MAFLPLPALPHLPFTRSTRSATCLARRPSSARRRSPSPRQRASDPILDDGDVDTTDISTFVSCPVCYNSIMLHPEQVGLDGLRVTCNCCEKASIAKLHRLENLDGTPFDAEDWMNRRGNGGRGGEEGEEREEGDKL